MDSQGIRPLEEKVQAIVEFPQPTSLRKLREFLGLINFYHRFIPKCADTLQPLTYALSSTSTCYSPRTIRHLDFISQFTTDIRHIKGADNSAADALSRVEVNTVDKDSHTVIDFTAMAAAQQSDPDLHKLQSSTTSLSLKTTLLPFTDVSLICDMSSGTLRPVVPVNFRRAVFDSLHSLSHPGIRATQRLLTARYVWPSINTDVRRWARSCPQCQLSKVHCHTVTPLSTFSTPDAQFDKVHLDIVGPLPCSRGFTYLLTCIDHFTH